jgi:FKBP-type peptidyl-prolyl cis-trans isomerase
MKRDTVIAIGGGLVILLLAGLFIFGIIPSPLSNTSENVEKVVSETETDQQQSMAQNEELKIEDTQVGTGEAVVESGDTVVIHYKGTLEDGTQFDSSYDRGEPFQTEIGVGAVIEGWDKGVLGMKVGGRRHLVIPPSMGYGNQDIPGIPANSTLLFDVELVEILK